MSTLDTEIQKYISLLGTQQKKTLLDTIKGLLHVSGEKKESKSQVSKNSVDYTQYRFPASSVKFNREEINER